MSDTWQSTYIINTTRLGFMEAEAACQDNGGHLVSYSSFEEQQEVEAAFVHSGEALGHEATITDQHPRRPVLVTL